MLNFFQNLELQKFCILVEYLTSTKSQQITRNIAGFPAFVAIADRVQSDHDMVPLEASQDYPKSIDKVLHFSGKGRDIKDFELFLHQASSAQIRNLLLITGDKLKEHSYGDDQFERTRYLESINAVMSAKNYGGFNIGVAFNPFKYTEAEHYAQYLKLHKKVKAGADFIITQLGYDMDALKEIKSFLKHYHYKQKILACVMPLSLARANFIVKNKVAGIVITPYMLRVLAQEKQNGLAANAYKRCAIQILMCKLLGFNGVHLSACEKSEEQKILQNYIEQYQHDDLEELEARWKSLWQIKTGNEFVPELTYDARQPTLGQLIKYHHLHVMHKALFESKISKGIGKFIFKASFWNNELASKTLLKTEFTSKHMVVGCENCGQCRLTDTLYICPETCPKGLANGPCGGTTLDRCEFGDRECIHSVKARLAKAVGQTDVLKDTLIATVPVEVRGTSSWKNWFLGKV